ncbi:unnamed protein product [Rhizophagus irregularis]|nr:unnamed protein product [Rhizophagus irregularis]
MDEYLLSLLCLFRSFNAFFFIYRRGRTWTWTSERFGRLEFRKGTPAWNSISAWAIKVSWGRRRPPRFGFHKGDALPGPGFWLGLLK